MFSFHYGFICISFIMAQYQIAVENNFVTSGGFRDKDDLVLAKSICDFAHLSRMIQAQPIFPLVTPASYPR